MPYTRDEANRKMRFAMGELSGRNSGYGSSYRGESNWKSRESVARSMSRDLRKSGYGWQADRVRNYRNRLSQKWRK